MYEECTVNIRSGSLNAYKQARAVLRKKSSRLCCVRHQSSENFSLRILQLVLYVKLGSLLKLE